MSRVITFSRYFPATHPKKGQPTYFVEKIYAGLISSIYAYSKDHFKFIDDLSDKNVLDFEYLKDCDPKHHTIRGGNRWKVGDKFSPRVWSGKPYASKQVTIAPDIEIKKIWTFELAIDEEVDEVDISINGEWKCQMKSVESEKIARNDGLAIDDFADWFAIHPKAKKQTFKGQIICWNENIEY